MQPRALFCVFVGSLTLAACAPGGRRDTGAEPLDEPAVDAVESSVDAPALDATVIDAASPEASPDAVAIDGAAVEASVDAPAGPESAVESAVEPCPTRGFTRCGGVCVDTTASAEHCGACGARCIAGPRSSAECLAGECARTCAAGAGDCDANEENGCETSLDTASNCGACGRACPAAQVCSAGACADFTALTPVPVAPLSGARVGRRRPELRWRLPAGVVVGAEVQLCRDRECAATTSTTVTVSAPRYVPSEDLEARTYFWRVRLRDGARAGVQWSPVWQFRVVPEGVLTDVPVGFEPDFNGDGRADIVVGAPEANALQGAVYVYYGGPSGPSSASPGWSGRDDASTSPDEEYGRAMSAGDVDGDGFVDLVVSNTGAAFAQGRLYVYAGSATGLGSSPRFSVPGVSAPSRFGASTGTVGDGDGDGLVEFLVGAPTTRSGLFGGAGAAFVVSSPRAGAAPVAGWATRETTVARAALGYFVAALGDTDGNGWPDLLVSAIGESGGPAYATAFLGSASGYPGLPAVRYEPPAGTSGFGDGVGALGDVDGDGFTDAMVHVTATELWLLRGSATGLARTASQRITPEAGFGPVGEVFAGGDDVNGDGRTDVVLTGGCGAVVYSGSAAGLATAGAVRLLDASGNAMGLCTVRAGMPGDVDGDGLGDVVITSEEANGRRGGVFLYLGHRDGVRPMPAWSAQGPAVSVRYGETLLR